MRTRVRGGGLQVTAVAGTGVVLLAFDCQHPALLGFIVEKRQATAAGGWQHMHARYLGSERQSVILGPLVRQLRGATAQ